MEVVLKPEGPLLPGPAEVRYRVRLAEGILLPAGSILVRDGEARVFVVQEGRAQSSIVRVLAQEAGQVAVEGIEVGAQVVYPAPKALGTGTPWR